MTRPRAGRPGEGKPVISTSTARPSSGVCRVLLCGPASLLLLSLFAEDTVRRGDGFVDDLISFDDEDRLSHALVEGNDIISASEEGLPGAAALGRA